MTKSEFESLFFEITQWAKVRGCAKSPKKVFIKTLNKKYKIYDESK